jgi:type II secretory pathway component GspD/PulD (secretin)
MSTRFLTRSLLAASLALNGAAATGSAQQLGGLAERPALAPQLENVLVERLYPVADLITPIAENAEVELRNLAKLSGLENLQKPAQANSGSTTASPLPQKDVPANNVAPAKTREDELVNLLTTCVDPESWSAKGGRSTIAYHAGCMTLAVHALPAHHEKIASILAGLRREQQTQVSLEVRMVSVPEVLASRIGLNFASADTTNPSPIPGERNAEMIVNAAGTFPRTAFLDAAQLVHFIEAIQGDPHTNIMQFPKITVASGRRSKFSAGDSQFFVTSVKATRVDGHDVFVPQNEVFPTSGFEFSVLPAVSADHRYVNLDLSAKFTKLAEANVRLFPVTTFITPVFEGGAVGQPVPFTQFLQQPNFANMAFDRKLSLPDGGTVLLTGFQVMSEGKNEFAPSMLSRIPYLNRLFKNPGYINEPLQVMLLVTPRIFIASEDETRSVLAHQVSNLRGANPSEAVSEPLPVLLAKYRQACAENRLTDAQALAAKALLMDPACFGK